jgi:hypothetical protein
MSGYSDFEDISVGEAKKKQEQFRKIGRCVYCGEVCKPTSDHVPPKALFPKPRPQDLITVPACENCNGSAAEDDAEFKVAVGLQIDPRKGDPFKALVDSTHRTLQKSALRQKLFRESKDIYVEIDGMYVRSKSFLWSSKSHDRTTERIIRGLYYRETGNILADLGVEVTVNFFHSGDAKLRAIANSLNKREIGSGAFRYSFGIAAEDPRYSIWFLDFHSTHLSGGSTCPLEHPK